jgi:hypothetical protein
MFIIIMLNDLCNRWSSKCDENTDCTLSIIF